jgi:hypothetical protein
MQNPKVKNENIESENIAAGLAVQKELFSKVHLSIWLDTYDDIFSDFDSSPYSERVLSDDFLNEAKKIAKEKISGAIGLKLLIPSSIRNKETEEVIIKNLHSHFRKHTHQLQMGMKKIRKTGAIISSIGILILVVAAYLVNLPFESFMTNVLRITLEPLGLFLVWTGLDRIFYLSRKMKPESEFNNKMAHAEILFLSI